MTPSCMSHRGETDVLDLTNMKISPGTIEYLSTVPSRAMVLMLPWMNAAEFGLSPRHSA